MHFSQRNNHSDIKATYQNTVIGTADSAKFLGVVIDKQLKWKSHIAELSKKLGSAAYALYKISPTLDLDGVITAYYGLVEPILRYGVIFLGNSTDVDIAFKGQKRCIRSMFKLQSIDSCKEYFIKHNILTFPCLYIFEIILFVKNNCKLFKTTGEVSQRTGAARPK